MRYRLMASFKGASYQAGVGPSDEEVTLFAASPPHEELGFLSSSNHWRKRVSVDDIDALWEARPVGRYRGEPCMVLDDLGDRMHIAYLGRDLYLARRLGFWEVDRGVFEVVVPRQDLDDLREERGEYELAVVGAAPGSSHGGWNQPNRETWAHTPREYGRPAPDTGPLRMIGSRGLIDTGPSWAADSRLSSLPQPMGWDDLRDVHAQDPRDTGTWAAVSETGELADPDGPFPRGRGGWRARDTGGWDGPDTGSWDAREVERAVQHGTGPHRADQLVAGSAGGRTAGPNQAGTGPAPVWNSRPPEPADRWSTPGYSTDRATGSWNTGELPAAASSPAPAPATPAPAPAAGSWANRDAAGPGPLDRNWDPQDTMAWSPVTAGEWDNSPRGWEQDEVARPAYPPPSAPTQDAAAVWHGSPFPDDAGRWNPPPAAAPPDGQRPSGSPRAITGGAHSAPRPGTVTGPRYDDPPLARQAAAITGAYAAPVFTEQASPGPAPEAPAAGAESTGSRYVGRRAARKPRVTTQTVFAQLLDLAAIPQSSYAVDNEVDGAMCLVRARGGYEVFSATDRTRHEVRFFEDEEAAYFYLFGVLAADAIRNGQLGPRR
jgi:hypothetical protein